MDYYVYIDDAVPAYRGVGGAGKGRPVLCREEETHPLFGVSQCRCSGLSCSTASDSSAVAANSMASISAAMPELSGC